MFQRGERLCGHAYRLRTNTIPISKWQWPDIPGLHSFAGDLIHTARWPENYDYADKKVAVIGNGSSGVQLVPAIQPSRSVYCSFWIMSTNTSMT